MLIDARVHDNKKTAILNIHPGNDNEKVEAICEDLDLNLTFAPKGELVPHQGIDVILDEGAFGWEPLCTYSHTIRLNWLTGCTE